MESGENNRVWAELKEGFSEEFIANYTAMIYQMASKFYSYMKLDGIAYLDEKIFSECMIDILYDLKRMKDFHELDTISTERLMAYAAGWIARRKPFQMIRSDQKNSEAENLNEKFAFVLLIRMVVDKTTLRMMVLEKKRSLAVLLNRVLYHLKYRDTDPKNLELLLCGIEIGRLVG